MGLFDKFKKNVKLYDYVMEHKDEFKFGEN